MQHVPGEHDSMGGHLSDSEAQLDNDNVKPMNIWYLMAETYVLNHLDSIPVFPFIALSLSETGSAICEHHEVSTR